MEEQDNVLIGENSEAESNPEPESNESEAESNPEPESKEEDNTEEDGEVIITIGDEEGSAPKKQPTPEWVKELRQNWREAKKENRELKAQLEAVQAPVKVEVGAKPKQEDYDYDTDLYENALTEWFERKREADAQAAKIEQQQQQQADEWQRELARYAEAKGQLKVNDFDEAEATILETLSQTQQGILVQGADNAALIVVALHRNPDKLQEFARIKDPVKFAFAVAKLEKDLKVTNRKIPPPPEKKVVSNGPSSDAVDSTLERLRADAARTGDYTKVSQYKHQQRAKR